MGRALPDKAAMNDMREENLVERTLSNLTSAWRDIAQSAAKTVGLKRLAVADGDPAALEALMRRCLEARGGEVSARLHAAELGKVYLELDAEGRRRFLETLAKSFAVSGIATDKAIAAYQAATETEDRLDAEARLRQALEPPRLKLLTQFNALPEGVKFLVDLRADLVALRSQDPYLKGLDRDLKALLTSWFDIGFLDLRAITWDSPASLLEKLIAYEAVHEIRSWDDLRNRLDSDRRCYALFHPRMPEEPLAFVEVALVKGITRNVQSLLDESAPQADPGRADSAIFYSISNTQKGLNGVSFGEYLIKRVVTTLAKELPGLKTFATLSPIPGFRRWLDAAPDERVIGAFTEEELGGLRALGGSDDPRKALDELLGNQQWHQDPVICKALKAPLMSLCTRYLVGKRGDAQPLDPVGRFHLKNGARLEHLNWLGDTSRNGLARSAGMMVNYRYLLDEMEKNHESYVQDGKLAQGPDFRVLTRALQENSPLRRLGFG
jgi:malonyl-CoA decarboxylase